MRPFIIPFTVWLAALQIELPNADLRGFSAAGELVSTAAALACLTVAVYRLGVWRQEMHNTKHNVGAEMARYREESSQAFARIEQRLASIEQFVAAATEERVSSGRW